MNRLKMYGEVEHGVWISIITTTRYVRDPLEHGLLSESVQWNRLVIHKQNTYTGTSLVRYYES